jgi:pyruvate kinase
MERHKFTKIVATIGPSSDSEEMIEKLILAGVNVFRFNFKHNTIEWHADRVRRVKKVAKKLGASIATLLDLQGPTIRIDIPGNNLEIKKGESLVCGVSVLKSKKKGFSISHPDIVRYLKPGQRLLADDGTFTFYVEKKGNECCIKSDTTGILKNRKSLNIPGADFPLPILTERDHLGLKLAKTEDVNIIALSFVRSAKDIKHVREQMKKIGLNAKICAKIETKTGIDNIDEIIDNTDSLMVARGDLGVELPIEEVPVHQKMMIEKCLTKTKPVITATQMLQSMIDNPYPTRAEVSDVANAVYDYTDAVMLSAESATGLYPLQAVEMMSKIVKYIEKKHVVDTRKLFNFELKDQAAILCDAAYNLYTHYLHKDHRVAGFVVFTMTGKTANLMSRYHPQLPIFVFTQDEKVRDNLALNFATYPFLQKEIEKEIVGKSEFRKNNILKAIEFLKNKKLVKKSDELIFIHGDFWAFEAKVTTIRIITVE